MSKMIFTLQDSTCGNCTFFESFKEQKRENNLIGACHANPPLPGNEFTNIGESKLGRFPIVLGNFWCGIFTSKGVEMKETQEMKREV